MKNSSVQASLCIFILILSLNPSQGTKTEKNLKGEPEAKADQSQSQQPNDQRLPTLDAQNIRRLIRPFYEQPYNPKEVSDLKEELKPKVESHMSAAQIVGDVERKKGYKEKPILYTTVISPKETSVTHTGVDPSYASMSLEARSKALRSKANKTEIGKLADGKYSVPVRLGNSKRLADPTKTEYDSPVFVEKKQYIGPPLASASLNPITQHFMNIAMGDSSVIKTNLQGANDPEAKFRNLLFARKQIKRDSMALIEKLREQIKRIEDTSLVNARLDRLLDRYSEEDKKKDRLDDLLKDLDSKLSSN